MLAIKKARKLITENPTSAASQTLADLVVALETRTPFALQELYELDMKRFELALDILKEWRLDRYYASKLRLIDTSNQAIELGMPAQDAKPVAEQSSVQPPAPPAEEAQSPSPASPASPA